MPSVSWELLSLFYLSKNLIPIESIQIVSCCIAVRMEYLDLTSSQRQAMFFLSHKMKKKKNKGNEIQKIQNGKCYSLLITVNGK